MRRQRIAVGWIALLVCFALQFAEASQVRLLNLAQMVESARRIVVGRCVAVEKFVEAGSGLPGLRYTLRIDEGLKSAEAAARDGVLTIEVVDGVSGMPRFAPGDELVLLLYGDSSRGWTSPVGLGQGAFVVRTDKNGRRVAVNDRGNLGLLDGLRAATRERAGLGPDAAAKPDALERGTLIELIRALVADRAEADR